MRAGKPGLVGVMLVGILTVLPGIDLFAQAPAPFVPAEPPPSLGRPLPLVEQPTPLVYTPPSALVMPATDPGPNGWAPYEAPSSPAGYFVDAEVDILWLDLKAKLSNDTGTTPSGNTFHLPTASLGVTAAPKIEFGYRLPDSCGFFAVSYRFFADESTGTQTFGTATFNTRNRLNVQVIDLDYGTALYEVAPNYRISYRIGARVDDIFFDGSLSSSALTQQASNSFVGAGPHGMLDAERKFESVQGLSLFGRLDAAVLVGQITQRFHEYAAFSTDEMFRHTQSVPNLTLQAGVSYIPPILPALKLTAGYQFEGYWYLGQFNANGTPGNSRGQLYTNGLFVRGQYDF